MKQNMGLDMDKSFPDTFTALVCEGRTYEQGVRLKLSYARLFNSKTLAKVAKEFGLSDREAQIAVLACKGVDTARTSLALGITPGTVKAHRLRVYRMMGVHCVEQMICKMILASGLLCDEGNR